MLKTLTKVGNSLALFIDKGVLELLNININTPLKVSTDGRNLLVVPMSESDTDKLVMASSEKISNRYKKVFKKLAK
ncbi:MAG: AbrB/MazE/SpoVT family DNA-binding domain-containing protein [Deltaproteobacteria bacterium]|nr:AbrB/MazE/SpoVT family DNA-binding domain-containing protein [Deltaproteobacteria bacterium]